MSADSELYVRYYVGHKGKFGHEYLEFEFRPDGEVATFGRAQHKGGLPAAAEQQADQLIHPHHDLSARTAAGRLDCEPSRTCMLQLHQLTHTLLGAC